MTSNSPGAPRAAPDGNRVYLTFDDGPDAQWTARKLGARLLRRENRR